MVPDASPRVRESRGALADTYYLAMEYVPGPTLKEFIAERGPLPESEALAITDTILAALAVAHAYGLVHRDVKPQNVLIESTGHARVVDFGIARAAGTSNLTRTNMVMGTAQYLVPEQVLQQPIDERTDLYNGGIVLYEMLTGRPPFTGDSPLVVALQHVHAVPLALHIVRPELSPATEAVVLRAIAKNPNDRYQTAAAFRAALAGDTRPATERTGTKPLLLGAKPHGTKPLPLATVPLSFPGGHRMRALSPLLPQGGGCVVCYAPLCYGCSRCHCCWWSHSCWQKSPITTMCRLCRRTDR